MGQQACGVMGQQACGVLGKQACGPYTRQHVPCNSMNVCKMPVI